MITLQQLTEKRKYLKTDLAVLSDELNEYLKNPVETIDTQDILNQFQFALRELRNVDEKIREIILAEMQLLRNSLENWRKLIEIQETEKRQLIESLPKKTQNMFEELLTVDQIKLKFDNSFSK